MYHVFVWKAGEWRHMISAKRWEMSAWVRYYETLQLDVEVFAW